MPLLPIFLYVSIRLIRRRMSLSSTPPPPSHPFLRRFFCIAIKPTLSSPVLYTVTKKKHDGQDGKSRKLPSTNLFFPLSPYILLIHFFPPTQYQN